MRNNSVNGKKHLNGFKKKKKLKKNISNIVHVLFRYFHLFFGLEVAIRSIQLSFLNNNCNSLLSHERLKNLFI